MSAKDAVAGAIVGGLVAGLLFLSLKVRPKGIDEENHKDKKEDKCRGWT